MCMSRSFSNRFGPSWVCHRLILVSDFRVGGEVTGAEPVLDSQLFGGLAFGREVFGLGPLIHQLRGEKGDLPPNAIVSHLRKVADLPSRRLAGPPHHRHPSIEGRTEFVKGKSQNIIGAGGC